MTADIKAGHPWDAVFDQLSWMVLITGLGLLFLPGAGTVRVAVAHGLGNTRRLMEAIRKGSVKYDFVEIMACPGGCVNGPCSLTH